MKLYAIRDKQLAAYTNIMQFPTDGVAIRAFTNETNRKESEIWAHPNDYDLHLIGTFDERTGNLENNAESETPLIRGIQVYEG